MFLFKLNLQTTLSSLHAVGKLWIRCRHCVCRCDCFKTTHSDLSPLQHINTSGQVFSLALVPLHLWRFRPGGTMVSSGHWSLSIW